MTVSIRSFVIKELQRVHDEPTLYVGVVEFKLADEIEGVALGHSIAVKTRFRFQEDGSVQALEQTLLEAALGLLAQTSQLAAGETLESLRTLSARSLAVAPTADR